MEADNATPAPEAQQPAEKKKRSLPKFAIIGAVLLVLTVASYYIQSTLLFGDTPETTQVVEAKEAKETAEEGEGHESTVMMLEEIIVNPADTAGRRYLSVTLGLQVKSAEDESGIEKQMPMVRDALISLLSSKQMEKLASIQYRDTLRTEIKEAVNGALHKVEIAGVVFSGYVLQ